MYGLWTVLAGNKHVVRATVQGIRLRWRPVLGFGTLTRQFIESSRGLKVVALASLTWVKFDLELEN